MAVINQAKEWAAIAKRLQEWAGPNRRWILTHDLGHIIQALQCLFRR